MSKRIAYGELASLVRGPNAALYFTPTLTVIPGFGCRLFVVFDGQQFIVVDDNDEPIFFPSLDIGVQRLSVVYGVDQHITIDIISLLGFASLHSAREIRPGDQQVRGEVPSHECPVHEIRLVAPRSSVPCQQT